MTAVHRIVEAIPKGKPMTARQIAKAICPDWESMDDTQRDTEHKLVCKALAKMRSWGEAEVRGHVRESGGKTSALWVIL